MADAMLRECVVRSSKPRDPNLSEERNFPDTRVIADLSFGAELSDDLQLIEDLRTAVGISLHQLRGPNSPSNRSGGPDEAEVMLGTVQSCCLTFNFEKMLQSCGFIGGYSRNRKPFPPRPQTPCSSWRPWDK